MTGTAMTEEEEFREIYNLDVVEVPTNRPPKRIDHSDLVYKTEKGKYNAVIEDIIEHNKKGQPVLVGTISIEKSELLSRKLYEHGIKHNVLKQNTMNRKLKSLHRQATKVLLPLQPTCRPWY